MKVQLPEKFQPLFKPSRYKVYYGGRGSGKSWAIARALLIKCCQKKTLVLCAREFQGSIQESVHRLLADQIDQMELSEYFEIQKNTIHHKLTGSQFIFEGLKNNITKIKSVEGIDICWCEEAEAITDYSWDILIPTIRKKGSEIWVSFNPFDELDPTYQRFVTNPPKDCISVFVNWQDNPWFPDELKKEMEECKERDPRKYEHIWEGQPNSNYDDSIIMPEWFDACVDAHLKLNFDPMGCKTASFDPADEGDDAKALCIKNGSVITRLEQWTGGDIDDAINKAFDIAFDERCDEIIYDSIGVGAAVKVGLSERTRGKKIKVTGFGGGDSVNLPNVKYLDNRSNKESFKNLRAQCYWQLRDRFEKTYLAIKHNRRVIDPDDLISISSEIRHLRDLKSELVRIQRVRSSRLIQIESKQDMRKRGMQSPNLADSLMMTENSKGFESVNMTPVFIPQAPGYG